MKNFLTTLVLLLALNAHGYTTRHDGPYVGLNIGGSKVSFDRTTNLYVYYAPYQQRHRYGLYGDLTSGNRCYVDSHLMLGYEINLGQESTIRYEQASNPASIRAHRRYIFNVLGSIMYDKSSLLMPYLLGGVSHTRFNIKHSYKGTSSTKHLYALGWCLGVGLESPISDTTSVNLQYLYTYYGEKKRRFTEYLEIYAPESHKTLTLGVKVKI